jgi:hypothetical protein
MVLKSVIAFILLNGNKRIFFYVVFITALKVELYAIPKVDLNPATA